MPNRIETFAREENFKLSGPLLATCRQGDTTESGYGLWLHSSIFTDQGGNLDRLGTNPEEIRSFLVQGLRGWVRGLRDGSRDVEEGFWDLSILNAYFLDGDALHRIPHEELDTTPEEIQSLGHNLEIRASKEELKKCRNSGKGPTEFFWGLRDSLLRRTTSFDEIGSTPGEITAYTTKYLEKWPYSKWDRPKAI